MSQLRFNRKPSPVIPEHRRIYKLAQLTLMLNEASRGGKASVLKLHLLNWALKANSRINQLVRGIETQSLDIQAWGFDPALSIAIRIAIAEKLIEAVSTGYQITDKGSQFSKDILKDTEILLFEKSAFNKIGKSVTERMVSAAADKWTEQ